MNLSLTKTAFSLALIASLSGCATQQIMRDSKVNFDDANMGASAQLKKQQAYRQKAMADAYKPELSPLAYVNTTPVKLEPQLPPVMFERMVFNQPYATPIDEVMEKLSQISGVPVSYEFDLIDSGARASGEIGGAPQQQADSTGLKSVPQVLDLSALAPRSSEAPKTIKVSVNTQGTFRDILNAVAGAIGSSWKYDSNTGEVKFYRYETKIFHVSSLPGSSKNKVGLGTAGADGGSSAGAESSLEYSSDTSVWKSIQDTLKTMVSSKGAFTVSDATGMVAVRDVPGVVNRVERYIKTVNQMADQQVSIEVRVFRVTHDDQDQRGINWKSVFNTARFSGSIDATNLAPQNAATSLASIILGIPSGQGSHSPFQGTQGVINSLSQLGKVSTITSTDVQTINNQPAPVKVLTKTSYLASVQNTSTANVGSTSTLTPGEVDTGFSMQVIPHVQPNGRDMLMQVMISLSTLNGITTFSSGGNTIQLPNVSTRDFVQRAWLHSGQSLVLAGLQNTDTNNTRSGLLDADAWAAGGSRQLENKRESIVVVITPVVTTNRNSL